VGGVVVNQVIEVEDRDSAPEFVRNRIEMQEEHLEVIRKEFGDQVRAVVPLYDDEVRGVPALEKAAEPLLR
jgi:anion-transporting  ArsA/GET3 family ATPase